jgi:hypothetical protein
MCPTPSWSVLLLRIRTRSPSGIPPGPRHRAPPAPSASQPERTPRAGSPNPLIPARPGRTKVAMNQRNATSPLMWAQSEPPSPWSRINAPSSPRRTNRRRANNLSSCSTRHATSKPCTSTRPLAPPPSIRSGKFAERTVRGRACPGPVQPCAGVTYNNWKPLCNSLKFSGAKAN